MFYHLATTYELVLALVDTDIVEFLITQMDYYTKPMERIDRSLGLCISSL